MTDINLWLHNAPPMVSIYYISQNRPSNAEVTNNSKTLSDLNKIFFFLIRDMPMSVCLGSAPN